MDDILTRISGVDDPPAESQWVTASTRGPEWGAAGWGADQERSGALVAQENPPLRGACRHQSVGINLLVERTTFISRATGTDRRQARTGDRHGQTTGRQVGVAASVINYGQLNRLKLKLHRLIAGVLGLTHDIEFNPYSIYHMYATKQSTRDLMCCWDMGVTYYLWRIRKLIKLIILCPVLESI